MTLVASKLSHTYPTKQIFIVFKYSVCSSSDCIYHRYKRERNQYICKCDSGLKTCYWFYFHHAERHWKLQQQVGFSLPPEQMEHTAHQKMSAMKWGLVWIICRRSCSILRRYLEMELIWEVFLDVGNHIDCLNIYYGLYIMDKTLFGFFVFFF